MQAFATASTFSLIILFVALTDRMCSAEGEME